MKPTQPNNPLHGVTLESMLNYLVAEYGWEELGDRIRIHCFNHEPSVKSSLKFLRKTDWARTKVVRLYANSISYDERHRQRESDPDEHEPTEKGPVPENIWDQARKK